MADNIAIEKETFGQYVRWIPSQETTDDWKFETPNRISLYFLQGNVKVIDSVKNIEILFGEKWHNFAEYLEKV